MLSSIGKLSRSAILVTLAELAMVSTSHGDIVLSIDDVQVTPGETAIVGVYASSNVADIISGFNLPLDLNNDGHRNLPDGFTYTNPLLKNALYSNTGLDMPNPQIDLIGVDAIPTGNGANVVLTGQKTRLFDIVIQVGDAVPIGTVMPIEILAPNSPFDALFNVAGPNRPNVALPTISHPVFGSISVVPEPSAAWLLSAAVVLRVIFKRFVKPVPKRL